MTDLPTLPDGRPLRAPLPRLVNFTHEDCAAKGLRAFDDASKPEVAVHFTAFEMISMHRAQLLYAPRGGGKTTLVRHLAAALKPTPQGGISPNTDALTSSAIRNPEGTTLPQVWKAGLPDLHLASPGQGAVMLAKAAALAGPALLIIDAFEQEPDPSALIRSAMDWLAQSPEAHLLILCESRTLEAIRLHPDLHSHALLPLPKLERQKALDPLGATDPFTQEWVEPGLWSLGLAEGCALNLREAAALPTSVDWLQEARDAETLGTLPVEAVISRAKDEPARWSGPLQMLVQQISDERAAPLAEALMAKMSEPLLLAAADLTRQASPHAPDLVRALIRTIETGGLAPALRRRGGESLARLGDRRDLTRLVKIPTGTYQMGGDLHPNSAPVHAASVSAFCIAAYPVTCAAYVHFTQATGRPWLSANGRDPERTSHPATNLTWHDARAYCAWLTDRWRAEGRIKPADIVRLPTECEWEAAARGPDGLTYPWGNDWAADHANDEETGFNDICTVGLFPEGTSALGCFDMVGQVWEWCTTLWGADMTTPSFRFPWVDDGRESLDAAPEIRRVLRGGCFSSGRVKANGIYRGSLEPSGFWRGNGFRIVVSGLVTV